MTTTTRTANDGWIDVSRLWLKGACFTCRRPLVVCFVSTGFGEGREACLLFERKVLRRLFAWQALLASVHDGNEVEEGTAVKKPDACCDCCTYYCGSCNIFGQTK